ncbi:protease HtpX [Leptospira sp. GIMC2001]|uniref:protease HtpX n=1 Tax=Leptospira sp. GIMC2001 TaxID=1513297 RepID=UPI00234B4B8A|nr:protease HtpX [Leptospira sp. GIMC2001]WCL47592.1 protease HtpX [Leptospira sp. GIMC2001]
MTWFKRIGLFLVTNILIIVTISIITNLLGVRHWVEAEGINFTSLLIFCSIWGFAGAFISLALSKVMAKWMMGVKIIDPNKAVGVERDLYARVQRLAAAARIPTPEVGIYDSPEINAFATGPTKSSSLVAVSTGLLNYMDTSEVDGVLAHEVSHVANGDMVTMTLVQGVVNAFTLFLSRVIAFAIGRMVREDLEFIVRFASTIVLDILFTILGSIIVNYFSRAREFRADAGAAKLAGRESMIAALEKLRKYANAPEDERGAALASLKISGKGKMMALFATHPPLEDRIDALRRNRY